MLDGCFFYNCVSLTRYKHLADFLFNNLENYVFHGVIAKTE